MTFYGCRSKGVQLNEDQKVLVITQDKLYICDTPVNNENFHTILLSNLPSGY